MAFPRPKLKNFLGEHAPRPPYFVPPSAQQLLRVRKPCTTASKSHATAQVKGKMD